MTHTDFDPRSKLAFAGTVVLAVAIPRLDSLGGLALVLAVVVGLWRGLTVREWVVASHRSSCWCRWYSS